MEALGKLGPDVLEGTRKRIIKLASELFSERSYLGVSMSDIARRLGVSKPALYHHCTSKMEIYAAVLDEVVAGLRACLAVAASADTPGRRLHQLVKGYLDFGMQEKNLINVLVVRLPADDLELRQRIILFRRELAEQVRPIIEDILADGRLPGTVDAGCVTEMLLGMMDGLLIDYSFFGKAVEPEKVADQILTVLGLQASPSAGHHQHGR